MKDEKTIFDKSQEGQHAYSLPKDDAAFRLFAPPSNLLRKATLPLPEVSELDLTRHFSQLARNNIGIDTHFYPLGSCTMKLNPRVNEQVAALAGFSRVHPLAPSDTVQGCLAVMDGLLQILCEVTGMAGGSLCPNAGAQGEFTGLLLMRAYHKKHGESHRSEILVPDTAHGTNPATATMAGYQAVSIRTNTRGDMDLDDLRSKISDRTAGLMLTNPNTLGLFSPTIQEITDIIHAHGGLTYCDGANMNAILNVSRPAEMGFDIMHINLHKTFSTPHGGGGPGAGPVLCHEKLREFLPSPRVVKKSAGFETIWEDSKSIGKVASFFGNFGVCLRAYIYAKLHGHFGLRQVAENAVLNANYLKAKLGKWFTIPYAQVCMHEFVVQADNFIYKGVKALDIAKRLLDYGIHAPTIYFPLIVKECLLIEPTETESKAALDHFVSTLEKIVEEINSTPELVKTAPHTAYRKRLDEVLAVKKLVLKAFT